jgi:hypothetical protein
MIQFENAIKRFGSIILNELKEEKINCWIAGGSLRDYFMGIPVNTDYDLFFPNEEEYNNAIKLFNILNAKCVWESDNGAKYEHGAKTFDLIKKFFPSPQACIDEFDFTICMFAVDSEKVYHGETSFIDLAKRQLMVNKITYPGSTLSRAFRYHKKGFIICLGETKKLIEAIQDMPKEIKEETKQQSSESANFADLSSGDLLEFFGGID